MRRTMLIWLWLGSAGNPLVHVKASAPGRQESQDPRRSEGRILPRYLAAAVLARLADDGARVAFILLAIERGVGAAVGGLVVAALLVPHVVAAPVVGMLADRVRARRLFYVAAIAAYGGALVLCALLIGQAPAPLVLLIATAGGCLGPLLTGGLTALLADLVAPSRLERAYALDVATYTVAGIAAPALTAALAVSRGPAAATVALGVSAGLGALLLGTLPIPQRTAERDRSRPPVTAGIAVLWRDRILRAATVASTLGHVGVGALPLAATLVASGDHSAVAGMLLSAYAIGAFIGALAYARWPVGATKPAWVVIGCLLGPVLPLAMASWSSTLTLVVALFAIAGSFTGPGASALFAVRERHAPVAVRVQVFTLAAGLKMTAAALGSGLAGLGAAWGGGGLLLAIAACFLFAAGVGVVLLQHQTPRSRHTARLHGSEAKAESRKPPRRCW